MGGSNKNGVQSFNGLKSCQKKNFMGRKGIDPKEALEKDTATLKLQPELLEKA
ncbi:MAG: hypothetical protein MUC57_07690 [Desulfobacterales bacterium]|jgi:hypothetical protein|nr:hypothetical protein [Desulfobacterales bacterium]